MKFVVALMATLVSVSSAHALLESHYGKLSYVRGEYVCTYTNNGHDKNMKWVYFGMEHRGAHGNTFKVQHKVDRVVRSGETITAGSGLNARFNAQFCKFLAR